MIETLTTMRAEDAVADVDNFLQTERGVDSDGADAATQVADFVRPVQEAAEDILTSMPKDTNGFYYSLIAPNSNRFDEAVTALPNHVVLVPSGLVSLKGEVSQYFPAIVSEDSPKHNELRLHVLHQPYRQRLLGGTALMLSASGQSETAGVGAHGKLPNDGLEAEHLSTLFVVAGDRSLQAAWKNGVHVNHTWREKQTQSVSSQTARLLGEDMPQSTITITRQQVESGRAGLLWHEGLRDEGTGRPLTATRANALRVMQGLAYQALRDANPKLLDTVKELIA